MSGRCLLNFHRCAHRLCGAGKGRQHSIAETLHNCSTRVHRLARESVVLLTQRLRPLFPEPHTQLGRSHQIRHQDRRRPTCHRAAPFSRRGHHQCSPLPTGRVDRWAKAWRTRRQSVDGWPSSPTSHATTCPSRVSSVRVATAAERWLTAKNAVDELRQLADGTEPSGARPDAMPRIHTPHNHAQIGSTAASKCRWRTGRTLPDARHLVATTHTPERGSSSSHDGQAVLRARGLAARLAGFLAAASGAGRAVGCRPRAALAASTLASSAAIMSTIFGFSPADGGELELLAGGLAADQVEDLHPVVVAGTCRGRTRRSATRRASRPSSPRGRRRSTSPRPASSSTSSTGTTSSA